jgi:MFS family permease
MAMQTIFVVYAADRLGFSAGLIGAVIAAGAAGSLAGSLMARAVDERLGFGPVTVGAVGAQCIGLALVPAVSNASRPLLVGWLTLSFLVMGLGTAMTNVNVVSLRQTITPPGLLGRMNAAYRFINWGVLPLGALAGGQLADACGDRTALAIVGVCGFASLAALWCSPLRRYRALADVAVVEP